MTVKEKMAVWHDQHAVALAGDDPAIVRMRESHEASARRLRSQDRTEPVKLSRERWEMLLCGRSLDPAFSQRPSDRHVILHRPLERDGVIFLPAEYVPAQDDALVMDVAPKHVAAMLRA